MKDASHRLVRWVSLFALLVVVAISACHKPPPPAPAPPPAAPPPPATPTVTLQANPSSITKGDSSTLSWSSTNATQLSITPEVGTVAPEGSTRVAPADSTTYTITATGPGGTANATAGVTVTTPPPPAKAPEPTLEELFARYVQDAYFDFNKADIRPDARAALSKTADFLKNYPQVKVTIGGHCDERGSTEYNLVLGDRRAAAVKQYLVSLGIAADRMNTVSYGKEKPFCFESNETCWQTNRRGHFVMAR